MKLLACHTVLAYYGLDLSSTVVVKESIGQLLATSAYLHTWEPGDTGTGVSAINFRFTQKLTNIRSNMSFDISKPLQSKNFFG